ncbi:MAG: hypothetical protein VXZ63_00510 [Planctomycetota bacterium]|nr:hypothetical protein [Planctomycetota bacterium]
MQRSTRLQNPQAKELRREDPSSTSSQENTAESRVLIMQGEMRKTWLQPQ